MADRKIQNFAYRNMNFELHHCQNGEFKTSTIISLPKPNAAIYIGLIEGHLSKSEAKVYIGGYIHGHDDGANRVKINRPEKLVNAYHIRKENNV